MKKSLLAIAVATACVSFGAAAESYTDSAAVVGVRAINERIPVNREECWSEQRRGYEERQVTRQDTGAPVGTVLGAIAGGVLGHQVGNGRGKDVATAGGAVVGGLIGNQIDRENGNLGGPPTTTVERRPVTREVERCRTVQEVREVPTGFDVRYRYNGREFVTRLPYDPGRRIRVAVDVRPVAEGGPVPGPAPMAPEYRR